MPTKRFPLPIRNWTVERPAELDHTRRLVQIDRLLFNTFPDRWHHERIAQHVGDLSKGVRRALERLERAGAAERDAEGLWSWSDTIDQGAQLGTVARLAAGGAR